MKNINPLFLTISCALIFVISIYSLNHSKDTLQEKTTEFKKFKKLAVQYNNSYKNWSDKKNIIKSIQTIVKSSGINNANIIQKNQSLSVQMTSLNIIQLNKFINKLLNKRIDIKKLELTKNKIILEVGIL